MKELEDELLEFVNHLEEKWKGQSKTKNELIAFWKNSLDTYVGKIRQPKDITKKPRRYFHLHAMLYCIQQTKPNIVWHLAVGNIKSSMPVVSFYEEQSRKNSNASYWINIDLVPEITSHNSKYLQNYFKKKGQKIEMTKNYLQVGKTRIVNITGTIEDFMDLIGDLNLPEDNRMLFLCLDGISNVAVKPEEWYEWWSTVRRKMDRIFEGWYVTWLQPQSLVRKFDFYYHVVLQKHGIPLNWVETTVVVLPNEKKGANAYRTAEIDFRKFTLEEMQKVLIEEQLQQKNVVFRFYADEEKNLLVYQALYLREEEIQKMVVHTGREYIGHKEIDNLLFEVTKDFYLNKEQNFVKSIPHLYLKKN